MAIVIGNRIVDLPGRDFNSILQGAGDLLGGIGQQRQQRSDQDKLTSLVTALTQGREGAPLPGGQVGPREAVPLTMQERLLETLNVLPQLNRPENREFAVQIAKLQNAAAATEAKGTDPVVDAIFTDDAGVKRKFKAKTSTIQESPQLSFPEVKAEKTDKFPITQVYTGANGKKRTTEFEVTQDQFDQLQADPNKQVFLGKEVDAIPRETVAQSPEFQSDMGKALSLMSNPTALNQMAAQTGTTPEQLRNALVTELNTKHPRAAREIEKRLKLEFGERYSRSFTKRQIAP